MKLKTLLNEIGFVGLVSKTGFVNNPPIAKSGPKTSIKEYDDDDWYSDDPDAPEPFYGDDDQFDKIGKDEPDWAEVLGDAAEDLDDIATSIEMQKDTIVRMLREYGEIAGQVDYDQMAGQLERYYNNILRNVELTQKHLNKGF